MKKGKEGEGDCIGIKGKERKNEENKKEPVSIHNIKRGIEERNYKRLSDTQKKYKRKGRTK